MPHSRPISLPVAGRVRLANGCYMYLRSWQESMAEQFPVSARPDSTIESNWSSESELAQEIPRLRVQVASLSLQRAQRDTKAGRLGPSGPKVVALLP